VSEITYVVRETYDLSHEEAEELVQGILIYFSPFLQFANEPFQGEAFRFEPRSFLYKTDGAIGADKSRAIPVPIGINLNLTMACNFKCLYCYQRVSRNGGGRLDAKKCLELVEQAADWGVAYLGMTGGEPTLFPGWLTILERILRRGMVPIFTTNGTVIGDRPELIQQMYHMGMREIVISLDTSKPLVHHYITMSKNSFEKVVKAIRCSIAVGIRTSVKCVLTPVNIDHIGEFIDFVVGLGVTEVGISYMEAGTNGARANKMSQLKPEQLEHVRNFVQKKQEYYRGRCAIVPPRNGKRPWREKDWYPCGGMYVGMSIFPSGRVTICDKLGDVEEFSYGNIFEQGLKEIWIGEKFHELRAKTINRSRISAECGACSVLENCRTGCFIESYVKTGDYFAKHPNCSGPF